MSDADPFAPSAAHSHFFLGAGHDANEQRTWWVVGLCGVMMVAEIVGGLLWGSIALIADGLHMSTHAGALLLAALAYRYARGHAADPRFSFGTGKFGDLAGFASAIILAMIALLIGYEAIERFLSPVPISFAEAIPIACLGLAVNVASVWLLSGGGHSHHHGHSHGGEEEGHRLLLSDGALSIEIHEDDAPPRFRARFEGGAPVRAVALETVRPDGERQLFEFVSCGAFLESAQEVPEPHAFEARIRIAETGPEHRIMFEEPEGHAHGSMGRDNNMRAALVHILADGAVSLLVIAGLLLARAFGWLWMDPLVGMVGAVVIAVWAYGLIRDTGAILLDMSPDQTMERDIRSAIQAEGDRLTDLHVWRLGPGHLGAIVSLATSHARGPQFYRERLARFRALSHVTVEVEQAN